MHNFNPRSPHGERPWRFPRLLRPTGFQSTLPARGATIPLGFNPRLDGISIHAPRTGSDKGESRRDYLREFQSTLPARGATLGGGQMPGALGFQSTLPARGATCLCRMSRQTATISIHAPRTGSDFSTICRSTAGADFNPRSPHGERRQSMPIQTALLKFQSTLPARGATSIPLL